MKQNSQIRSSLVSLRERERESCSVLGIQRDSCHSETHLPKDIQICAGKSLPFSFSLSTHIYSITSISGPEFSDGHWHRIHRGANTIGRPIKSFFIFSTQPAPLQNSVLISPQFEGVNSKAHKRRRLLQRRDSVHKREREREREREMNPFTSYYGGRSCSSNGENYFEDLDGGDSILGRKLTAEEKAIAASKSHSEAERRRRRRINGHLNTLRSILPDLIKTDKASLLAEVVRRVRELKATAAAVETGLRECHDDVSSSRRGCTKEWVLPGETDEVSLGYCEEEPSLIKAILCCEDRPELMRDVIRAVKSVKVKVVRAEMATIGGRTKCVIWVTGLGGSGEGITTLRRALKVVVDRPGLSGGYCQGLSGNKRTRFSHLSLPSFPGVGR